MIDNLTIEQAAFRGKAELQLTSAAFSALRQRYLDEILGAQSPEEAWGAVLAMRAVNSVATSLHHFVETGEIEKHYEDEIDGGR